MEVWIVRVDDKNGFWPCCFGPSAACMPWSDRDAQEERKTATASSAGVIQTVCTLFE